MPITQLTKLTLCWGVLFVLAAVSAGADWSRFRGPSGDGVAASGNLPIEWGTEKGIRWRTEVPGQGWSSPVVAGDRIYLTAAIPVDGVKDAFDLTLLVFDAVTGKSLERHDLIRQTAEQTRRIHAKNSHASPTPILSGDRVYVHFGYQGTVACRTDGTVIWKNRDLTFPPVHGNGGSPILVGDRLIFTCDGKEQPYVVALDAGTGNRRWRCDRPVDAKKKFSFCTPAEIIVDGKTQVVAPGSDCVLGIDPEDGAILWQVDYDGYSVVPKPVFRDGLLYVCTSFDAGRLLAIDPRGTGNLTESKIVWRIDKGAPKTPSLIVDAGLLFLINDAGVAECLDAKTGERVWQKRVGGKFSASPILADGKIYLTDEAGVTTVIKASREYEVVATNDLDERTLASAAVIGDAFIMRTDKAIYRIEKQQ